VFLVYFGGSISGLVLLLASACVVVLWVVVVGVWVVLGWGVLCVACACGGVGVGVLCVACVCVGCCGVDLCVCGGVGWVCLWMVGVSAWFWLHFDLVLLCRGGGRCGFLLVVAGPLEFGVVMLELFDVVVCCLT